MTDVPRWTADGSDAPSSVREIFRSAESDGPAGPQVDALWAKLQPLIGPGDGGPGGDGGGGAIDASTAAVSTAAIGTIGTAAPWVRPLVTALIAGTAITSSAIWMAGSGPRSRAPMSHARAAVSVTIERPPPRATDDSPPAEPEPTGGPVVRAAPHVMPMPVEDARPTEPEAAYLQRAHAMLRAGDAAKALMMAEEHRRLYSRPALGQERELIIVQSLVQLGRKDEATARAKEFLDRYPASAHARRLRTILGLPDPGDSGAEEKSSGEVIIGDGTDHSQPERTETGVATP